MTIQLDLWGNPIPEELLTKKPTKKKYRKPEPPQYDRAATDIELWLRNNRPETYEALKDLRAALYQRKDAGDYKVQSAGSSYAGEERLSLTGPESSVLIVSEKARKFLLSKLRRLRAFLDS